MLPAGTILGNRYEILCVLTGEGRTLIYTGRDTQTGQLCSIKVLADCNESIYKRFQREANIVSKLDHPNICRLVDCRLNQRTNPFIVMEHVIGQDMETFLTSAGPQPPQWSIPVFLQLCDALSAAHQANVVHRNVKPSTVMLTGDIRKPCAKLLDFGLAKNLQSETAGVLELTEAGVAVGTLLYLSPEQCKGKAADARSDVFALGCLMYRTFTGKNAFQARNLPELTRKHAEKPQKIGKANPNMQLPEKLEQIIFCCLERNPANRFQSMDELKKALAGEAPVKSKKATVIAAIVVVAAACAAAVAALVLHKPPGT